MFEAVVTFVTMTQDAGATFPVTKVYRLEFDTEGDFETWLRLGDELTTSTERLGAIETERGAELP